MTGPPKVGGARPGDALRLRLVPPRGSRQGVSRERAAVDFLEAGLEAANQFYFVIAIRVAAVAPHVLPQHFGGHSISSSVVKAPTLLDDMFEMFFHLRTTTRRRVAKLVCGFVLRCCGAVRRNRAAISPVRHRVCGVGVDVYDSGCLKIGTLESNCRRRSVLERGPTFHVIAEIFL